jgi:hypothetical protein
MGWTYRYLLRRMNRIANQEELTRIDERRQDLIREESTGARWRRNPDGSWSRWSYLGNEWEQAPPPEALVEMAGSSSASTEWTRTPLGAWISTDAPQEPAPEQQQGPPATPHDPWHDVPPPRQTWAHDVSKVEPFTWVEKPQPPSPPVRSPGPSQANPHSKPKRRRKP